MSLSCGDEKIANELLIKSEIWLALAKVLIGWIFFTTFQVRLSDAPWMVLTWGYALELVTQISQIVCMLSISDDDAHEEGHHGISKGHHDTSKLDILLLNSRDDNKMGVSKNRGTPKSSILI